MGLEDIPWSLAYIREPLTSDLSSSIFPTLGSREAPNISFAVTVTSFSLLLETEGSRYKRATDANYLNLSPNDRPNCQPGVQKPSTQVDTTQRLADLRRHFGSENIDAYIVPSEDAHQSEYPSDYDLRRQFISGLTGSAGMAMVLGSKAALFTDGRYFLQAEAQLDCNWILLKEGVEGMPTPNEWLIANLAASNGTIGADPLLVKRTDWLDMENTFKRHGITMKTVSQDLVDKIWISGRPLQPSSDVNALPLEFAGLSWQQKLDNVQASMTTKGADSLILTGLDETAWMFNLRGSDIAYNPFFLSYAIIEADSKHMTLFLRNHASKLNKEPTDSETTANLTSHLNTSPSGQCTVPTTQYCVKVLEYDTSRFLTEVDSVVQRSQTVWVSYIANYAVCSRIPKLKLLQDNTPAAMMKAQKNDKERQGMRNSHIRDAEALIRFVSRLEKEVKEGKQWTEVSAAQALKKSRESALYNRGLSFPSISGVGEHGAVIHYKPTNETDARITTSEMYLLDSGGLYLDGTTDVTRTFHFGTPTAYEKECYTRVLMGQIDLADLSFQKGVFGREIDAVARRPLWDVGLIYRHGTGHGIGMYLSVHEGPGRISLHHSRFIWDIPLDEHQTYSDEPGYYEDGKFGIRLENIVMIKKVDTKYKYQNSTMLGFETITLVPYEPNLINYDILSDRQINWINDYHKKTLDRIGPLVKNDATAYSWLVKRCAMINRSGTSASEKTVSSTILIVWVGILTFICS
ncbi:hypothetical protein FSP39_006609 [Pinctada imbricata]|uniref:Xaa-Pro aminopeptidase 1 n=1 Tax=Pinctada imbricata TaxID=66713 RepID=A0AA89C6R9_PINIB|nr:hypothetical protein FSP39_006609 [Pinctada imbricata]